MNKTMHNISHVLSYGNCWQDQNGVHKYAGCGENKGTKQISSKYILDNNSIVYEQYDRYGKVILRIPWSARVINVKY
jgi:hypothetical protein